MSNAAWHSRGARDEDPIKAARLASSTNFGVRAAPEVPFTPYKTFQTTITEIEKLTGLTFTGTRGSKRVSLSEFVPLAKRPKPRGPPGNYVELQSLS